MIFKEETFVIKVWNHLFDCCLCWFQNYQKGSLYETSNRMFWQRFECQFQLGCFYVRWLMLFERRWTPISEMNKELFLHYFFKKDKNTEKAEEITTTKVASSIAKEITNAELRFAVNEIDKSHGRPKKYQKKIPGKVMQSCKLEIMH